MLTVQCEPEFKCDGCGKTALSHIVNKKFKNGKPRLSISFITQMRIGDGHARHYCPDCFIKAFEYLNPEGTKNGS